MYILVKVSDDHVEALHAAAERQVVHVVGAVQAEAAPLHLLHNAGHVPLHERLRGAEHVALEGSHGGKVAIGLLASRL